MPVFSETNKCIFNYMSKNLYIVLINLQMTICQLSPFFISNFSFSILLLSFPMQKYITCLAKCFLATTALAIEVATLMYDLFPWQIVLFLPEMASTTAPNFPKPLQSCSCILSRILLIGCWANCCRQFISEQQKVGKHRYAI